VAVTAAASVEAVVFAAAALTVAGFAVALTAVAVAFVAVAFAAVGEPPDEEKSIHQSVFQRLGNKSGSAPVVLNECNCA
jgi:hypothetical protein